MDRYFAVPLNLPQLDLSSMCWCQERAVGNEGSVSLFLTSNRWHACSPPGGQQHSAGRQTEAMSAGERGVKSSDRQTHCDFKVKRKQSSFSHLLLLRLVSLDLPVPPTPRPQPTGASWERDCSGWWSRCWFLPGKRDGGTSWPDCRGLGRALRPKQASLPQSPWLSGAEIPSEKEHHRTPWGTAPHRTIT